MPRVARPGNIELHWEEAGEGPAVVIAMHWSGHPRYLRGLRDDLARDHRVILYHLRGTGQSTRAGPYDVGTDAGDLAAVVEAAGEREAVVIAFLDAVPRAVRAALDAPELVGTVVAAISMLRIRTTGDAAESMADSPSVLQAMLQMIETSYRAGLRNVLATGNPGLDDSSVHSRVEEIAEFIEAEAATERLRRWTRDNALIEDARAIGDRLWWLTIPTNPWFPADLGERVHDLLPDARVESLEDGAFSRPDLTAAVVRRITGRVGS